MRRIAHAAKEAVMEVFYFLQWLFHYKQSSPNEAGSNVGEKVVLVCNGPSAGQFPYEVYKKRGYSFCCVNYFAMDRELFFKIKPKFYCIVDPVFGSWQYQQTKQCKNLCRVLEQVDWEMSILCSKNSYLKIDNEYIHYRFINSNIIMGELNTVKIFLLKHNMASCGAQNVSVAAVYYFVMSKVDHLVLTGVENDWHRELMVDEENNVFRELVHFYGKDKKNVIELGQIKKGELYKYFEWYALTLKQHSMVAAFAKAMHVSITNTCLTSYIDVYQKAPVLSAEEASS